jgi:hypothetical protein
MNLPLAMILLQYHTYHPKKKIMEYRLWRVPVAVPRAGPGVLGGGQRLPVEQEAEMGDD